MKVKSCAKEYSGTPKNVAADCEVAKTEIATASIGIEFADTKYSLVELILELLNMYDEIAKMAK